MRTFLLSLNNKFQVLFIVGMTVIVAFIVALVTSLFFDEHQLVTSGELISSVYQVMGTIYAILLTFTLWGVWQNFTKAGDSVQHEAYSLLDLVHIVEAAMPRKENDIRHVALSYAANVVNNEWPNLRNLSDETINMKYNNPTGCLQVVRAVQAIKPANEHEATILGQSFTQLSNWLNARRTRLLVAKGNSAKALWSLLFIGALVLFAFHGLFVARTFAIWATLLFGTSLVIGVTFYLIFTLDSPFDGILTIDSEPFVLAIKVLKSDK